MDRHLLEELLTDVVIGKIPSVIVWDDGTDEGQVIPAALLSDGSYLGPRDVVMRLYSTDDIPGAENWLDIEGFVAGANTDDIWDTFSYLVEAL